MTKHLVSTPPTAAACVRCGRLRYIGLDGGLPYRVDPVPLVAVAELAAVLSGLRSYEHVGVHASGQLVYRDRQRIQRDVTRGRPLVFAEHRCGLTPAESDVDRRFLRLAATLLQRALHTQVDQAIEAAVYRLNQQFGARVVSTPDKPPF